MKLLKLIAIGGLVGTYITFAITFITAYLHPDKQVLVTINDFGEANMELAVLLILFPIIVVWFVREVETERSSEGGMREDENK